MAGQLIPPPGMEPKLPEGTTSEQRIEAWIGLMNTSGAFLTAGLRNRLGGGEDLIAGLRDWYNRSMDEHDQTVRHMLKELADRERNPAW